MVIRYHLDEHIHPGIAVGLRARGIDVTTTADANLGGADDEKHLSYSLGEQRVLVTNDDDFLSLHASGIAHAGIAYCHQDKYSIGVLLQMLMLLHACETTESMLKRVEFL